MVEKKGWYEKEERITIKNFHMEKIFSGRTLLSIGHACTTLKRPVSFHMSHGLH